MCVQGDWKTTGDADSPFLSRFGVLFEGVLGPAVIRLDASYRADPATGASRMT